MIDFVRLSSVKYFHLVFGPKPRDVGPIMWHDASSP